MSADLDIHCRSLADTRRLASLAAFALADLSPLGLHGELGVGKTEFVRALVQTLEPNADVASPTFILESVHSLTRTESQIKEIHHWDLYRIHGGFDLSELLELASNPANALLIEWPEKVPALADAISTHLEITFVPEDTGARRFRFSGRLSAEFRKLIAQHFETG